ncbi:hypothetical protein ACFSQ7_24595 [Paenibacillus rhizoplanae]
MKPFVVVFEKLFMEMRGVKSFRSMICQGILQELLGITARELEQPEIAPMKVQYARTIQNYLFVPLSRIHRD